MPGMMTSFVQRSQRCRAKKDFPTWFLSWPTFNTRIQRKGERDRQKKESKTEGTEAQKPTQTYIRK